MKQNEALFVLAIRMHTMTMPTRNRKRLTRQDLLAARAKLRIYLLEKAGTNK